MPKGFRYISDKTLAEGPHYYAVLTQKGKNRRKNVIRTGTYKTRKDAKKYMFDYAKEGDRNIRIFDLRKMKRNPPKR